MSVVLTWLASVLCALGFVLIYFEVVKRNGAQFVVQHPIFLPLYSAGIFQWFLSGIKSGDAALILPTLAQLIVLILLLKRWYVFRVKL